MLTYLKWPTLQDRRTIARLTLLFKILHEMIAIPDRCLPLPAPISSTIFSSLLTYRRELMFTSTHFYHERLFNGINYKFLSTTLTLTCSAPYAYIVPYAYGTSHMRILIWDAHTRMGQHFVPYEYFICMFYFFTGLWILLL